MLEQGGQIRIGRPVEDDEAGVDRDFVAIDGRHDGVGMAADPVGLLVHRDIVALAQQPCRGQAGNPGSNHRHLQPDTIPHQVHSIVSLSNRRGGRSTFT